MSDDNKKPEFILTDELRAKAGERPQFNILFIGDKDSHLSPFRGEAMLRTFAEVYHSQANITYMTATSDYLSSMKLSQFDNINILWIDNVSDFHAAQRLNDIQSTLLEEVHPGWRDEVKALQEDSDEEGAIALIRDINKKREEKLKVIYSIDEWIWEGPIGRAHDIQTVQIMETFLNMADGIVTPTQELREAIQYYKFVSDPQKPIYPISSAVNSDFFQLFRDFSRTTGSRAEQLRNKPKVLVKGISVPDNIQQFIVDNYKKMEITICSVGEVNPHLMGLMQSGKVNHIYHWANPFVNKTNINATYAIERDAQYDFVIHTKPDNLVGDLYEIAAGDEDILFSIAYGALPICGVEHLGYDENSGNLSVLCGLTFGKDTNPKKIRQMIDAHMVPVTFNEKFNRCRAIIENRLAVSPLIGARYFSLMLSDDIRQARSVIAAENAPASEPTKSVSEAPKNESEDIQVDEDKIIAVDFATGEVK